MRACIVGAGAVGGFLAASLARAGHDVSVVARGAHLAAMREHGLRLESGGASETFRLRCAAAPVELPAQEAVFVLVKEPALPAVLPTLAPLLEEDTPVVVSTNGIPWWFFRGLPPPWRGRHLERLDPGGRLDAALEPRRLLGCVVNAACTVVAPGVVRHSGSRRFILGEPAGGVSARAQALADVLRSARLEAPVAADIQAELWSKLMMNLPMSPVAALTGSPLQALMAHAGTRALAEEVAQELREVATRLGIAADYTQERRAAMAAKVGPQFRHSMLQDFEAGRPPEIDALLGAALDIAQMAGVEVPRVRALLALVSMKARVTL